MRCCKKSSSIQSSCVLLQEVFLHPTILPATGRQSKPRWAIPPPQNPTQLPKISVYKSQAPKQTMSPGICYMYHTDPQNPKDRDNHYPPRFYRYSLRTPTLVLATTSSLLFSCRMPIILNTSSLARIRVGSKGRRWDWFRSTSAMTCCSAHVSLHVFIYDY